MERWQKEKKEKNSRMSFFDFGTHRFQNPLHLKFSLCIAKGVHFCPVSDDPALAGHENLCLRKQVWASFFSFLSPHQESFTDN